MLTQEDNVDAHALRWQGWTITAIALHLGHDRKTIRAYLKGRVAGERVSSEPDPFESEPLAAPRVPSAARYALQIGTASIEFGDDFREETLRRVVTMLRSC